MARENYITEKIVDCLTGWATPIYSGANNIDEFLGGDIPKIPFGCSPKIAIEATKKIIARGGMRAQDLKSIRKPQ